MLTVLHLSGVATVETVQRQVTMLGTVTSVAVIIVYVTFDAYLFSERVAICCRSSVCLSSVTFVRPTQAVEIFGNISTAFGTLAILDIY